MAHVFDASWSIAHISKSCFLLPSVFPAGSRQQKENTIIQMCTLTLPKRSRIYYTNMWWKRITPALYVSCICVYPTWDMGVSNCYSALVAVCLTCAAPFPSVYISTGEFRLDSSVISIPSRLHDMTSKWNTFCTFSQCTCSQKPHRSSIASSRRKCRVWACIHFQHYIRHNDLAMTSMWENKWGT